MNKVIIIITSDVTNRKNRIPITNHDYEEPT